MTELVTNIIISAVMFIAMLLITETLCVFKLNTFKSFIIRVIMSGVFSTGSVFLYTSIIEKSVFWVIMSLLLYGVTYVLYFIQYMYFVITTYIYIYLQDESIEKIYEEMEKDL